MILGNAGFSFELFILQESPIDFSSIQQAAFFNLPFFINGPQAGDSYFYPFHMNFNRSPNNALSCYAQQELFLPLPSFLHCFIFMLMGMMISNDICKT